MWLWTYAPDATQPKVLFFIFFFVFCGMRAVLCCAFGSMEAHTAKKEGLAYTRIDNQRSTALGQSNLGLEPDKMRERAQRGQREWEE